jgi:hypothetical protein
MVLIFGELVIPYAKESTLNLMEYFNKSYFLEKKMKKITIVFLVIGK